MADSDARPRMTADDIALMREIVQWRKNHEIDFVRRRVYGSPYWVDYRTGREVWFEYQNVYPLAIRKEKGGWSDSIPARTLTEAVDVLVALGFLPPRFSSAYRAGWHAARIWYHPVGNEREFVRLFHDPENISFPAGGEDYR